MHQYVDPYSSVSSDSTITLLLSGRGTFLGNHYNRGKYVVSFISNLEFYSIRTYSASDNSGLNEYLVSFGTVSGQRYHITIDENVPFSINIRPGVFTPPLIISEFMVCPGDSAPDEFVPYTEPQNLVFSTPSGLPGIPVESGGNFTDADGQRFASDCWDFGDGQQHILCGDIASYNGEEITTPYISTTGALTTGARVLYVLPKPRTEPIPDEIMAAYRALTTYDGATVVGTAEPVSGIQARYVADGTKCVESIESRLAALEAAIIGGIA